MPFDLKEQSLSACFWLYADFPLLFLIPHSVFAEVIQRMAWKAERERERKFNELIYVPDVIQFYDWHKQHNICHVFSPPIYLKWFLLLPSTVLETVSLYLTHSRSLGEDMKGHVAFLASPFLRSPYTTKTATFLLKSPFKIVCMNLRIHTLCRLCR